MCWLRDNGQAENAGDDACHNGTQSSHHGGVGEGARDVLISAARVLSPAAVFLQVEGAASRGITIDGGDLSKAAQPVSFRTGASRESVKLRAIV